MVMKIYDLKYLIMNFLFILFTFKLKIPPLKTKVINTKLPNFAPAEVESQIDRVLKINAHAITKEEIL